MRKIKALTYAWVSQKFMAGCSNYNPLEVRKNSRSKAQARDMFRRHDIPHAEGEIFINPWRAYEFAQTHGFPLVIKPNVSGFSRGSHFPIENYVDLWKATFLVKIWWPSSVIEQYLLGANYRVLATPENVVSVIRRYPPFIDGDGTSTIEELMEQENTVRRNMRLLPTIYLLKKSAATTAYLKKQSLTYASVPKKGKRVTLFNRVALAPGGVVEIIDQRTIPSANQELFIKIIKIFDAQLFGVDVIFEQGIEVDYRKQQCIFLEVNSRPYTEMHNKPRFGKVEDLSDFFQKMDSLTITDTDTF